MAPEGSQAAIEEEAEASNANWYITELEAEIDRLWLENRRLKSSQSWGFVRAGNAYKDRPKIDTSKPRVEAIDIPPVTAQLPDD